MSSKWPSLVLAFSLALSFAFTGCDEDDDNPIGTTPQTANIMVIHASPDAPGVDILVDNTVAVANLTFPNNSGYRQVTAGIRNIKANVAGTATTVIQANVPVAGGVTYSVFATDSVASLAPLLLVDTLTTPAAGKAHVRFVHLSPNAPAVDITLTDGTVVFGNKLFQESTSFTPLDAGTYTLQVRAAGTTTVVLELPPITLVAGKIYTVFAKGFLGGTGAQELGAQIIANN